MTFKDIKGNDKLVEALTWMVDSGRLPHAIMFHEDDGGGALAVVIAFLQYLYCHDRAAGDSCNGCPSCNKISKLIHPDVHFVFPVNVPKTSVSYSAEWRELVLSNPFFTEAQLGEALGIEGKSSIIAVSEARALVDVLALSGLEGGYRSVVVYLPEKMNQEAANRLLKLVEEPPARTQFLFITHSPDKVLVTIASRCQCLRVLPPAGRTGGSADSDGSYRQLFDSMMAALLDRDLLRALEAGEEASALPSREHVRQFLKFASEEFRQMFLLQQNLSALSACDQRTGAYAAGFRKNFPRLASEALDRANLLVSRNVNVKIIFTELVDKLYTIL